MRKFFTSLFRRVASVLVICIVTANLAMAGYVCPDLTAMVEATTPASKVMAGTPCAEMDMEKPAQCVQFQSGEQLALEHFTAPAALSPMTAGSIILVRPLLPAQSASPVIGDLPLLASTGPPYLQTQRLRI